MTTYESRNMSHKDLEFTMLGCSFTRYTEFRKISNSIKKSDRKFNDF